MALPLLEGLEPLDSWRGILRRDGVVASVLVEARDRVRVEAAVSAADALAPRAALLRSGSFPLDLRFARHAEGLALVADTRLGRADEMQRTLELLVAGIAGAAACRAAEARRAEEAEPGEPQENARLRAALEDLRGRGEGVVERPDGFELRPRLCDETLPVRLCPGAEEVTLEIALLEQLPARTAGDAIADLCLRVNHRLRFARLALRGQRLVAETRLCAEQVDAGSLASGARAVAAASLAVRASVALLCRSNRVALGYAETFLTPNLEAPASAGDERR